MFFRNLNIRKELVECKINCGSWEKVSKSNTNEQPQSSQCYEISSDVSLLGPYETDEELECEMEHNLMHEEFVNNCDVDTDESHFHNEENRNYDGVKICFLEDEATQNDAFIRERNENYEDEFGQQNRDEKISSNGKFRKHKRVC